MSSLTENLNKAAAELAAENGQDSKPKESKPKPQVQGTKGRPIKGPSQEHKEPVWSPKLENKGGNLRLVYKTQVQGLSTESSHEILDSKATEYLYPLVKPLCKLVNAVVNRGIKALKSSGPKHLIDAKGRPTKEVEMGSDGKPIMLPSPLDVAKSAYAEMLKDPEVVKLLGALQKRLNIVEGLVSGDNQDETDSDGDNGKGGGTTAPDAPRQ